MSRPQIVKGLWNHIKENQLQNPNNKREIICDPSMKAIFNVDKIDMFQMNKVLGQYVFNPSMNYSKVAKAIQALTWTWELRTRHIISTPAFGISLPFPYIKPTEILPDSMLVGWHPQYSSTRPRFYVSAICFIISYICILQCIVLIQESTAILPPIYRT